MVLEDDTVRILIMHGTDVVDAIDIAVLASMIIVFIVAILHIIVVVTFILVVTAWLLPLLLVLLFTRLLAFFLSFLFFVVNSLVLDAAAERARGRVRRDLRRGTGSSGARSSEGPAG